MTMSDSQEENNDLLGGRAANVLLRHLKSNPTIALCVHGRVGAQPNIRCRMQRWELASWAGAGELMTREADAGEVRTLIRKGPEIRLRPVSETEAFVKADERGEFG
jgi:hypothetical protein